MVGDVITKSASIAAFSCIGPDCSDTCCKQFTVQVDAPTLEKYRKSAPELLDFITEKKGVGCVLAFDATTGFCPKLQAGSCSVHASYGTEFLTDTCHLYPRITRGYEDALMMAGALSCPEVARIALYTEHADDGRLVASTTDRVPTSLKNYAEPGLPTAQAFALHARFLSLAGEAETAESMLAKLVFFSTRFAQTPKAEWPASLDASWRVLEVVLPKAETHPHDDFFLMIAFATILAAAKLQPSPRLQEVITTLETVLECQLDASNAALNTTPQSLVNHEHIRSHWKQHHDVAMQAVLKKLVASMLSANFYPFAGVGNNAEEKITALVVHYATMRLALMAFAAHQETPLDEATVVHVVQAISRVLEHLPSLDSVLPMYQEAGWTKTARLLGLLKT